MAKSKQEPKLRQRFFGVPDAATYLGCSQQFIYNGTAHRAKKPFPIPFRRIGGKILFDIADLEKI